MITAMTKKEIIYRLSAIAHSAQETISSTVEERESAYRSLTLELLHDEISREYKRVTGKNYDE